MRVLGAAGVEKERFQQSASTHFRGGREGDPQQKYCVSIYRFRVLLMLGEKQVLNAKLIISAFTKIN